MPHDTARVLITGANGHLGRRLLARLAADASSGARLDRDPDATASSGAPLTRDPDASARAFVRSERAAATLRDDPLTEHADIVVGDYTDEASLAAAMQGCSFVAHFVGIIKESEAASYEDAHEATCRSVARAAASAGVERIVYLSILGARPGHSNGCLASKGRAEDILLAGSVPATVLRVPMVIGEGDYAAASLGRAASARIAPLVAGGRTRQQPIDADDVLASVVAAFGRSGAGGLALDLGGPENLSHRELVARAARVLGRPAPTILPIPRGLVTAAVWLMERTSASPGMTLDMLEILEQDDRVEAAIAFDLLGIEPTPLDETLARCLGASEVSA